MAWRKWPVFVDILKNVFGARQAREGEIDLDNTIRFYGTEAAKPAAGGLIGAKGALRKFRFDVKEEVHHLFIPWQSGGWFPKGSIIYKPSIVQTDSFQSPHSQTWRIYFIPEDFDPPPFIVFTGWAFYHQQYPAGTNVTVNGPDFYVMPDDGTLLMGGLAGYVQPGTDERGRYTVTMDVLYPD